MVLLSFTSVFSQTQNSRLPDYLIGVYGFHQTNFYNASFNTLPGTVSCCVEFQNGGGTNFAFGGLFEKPISDNIYLQFRLGYNGMSGIISENDYIGNVYNSSDFENAQVVSANVEHKITAKLSAIELSPLVSYYPLKDLGFAVNAGFQLAYMFTKTYEMEERLTTPANLNFSNGRKTRNEQKGDIKDASSLFFGIYASLSYDLFLSKRLILSPEIGYSLGLTRLISNTDWKTNALRIGASAKYVFEKEKKIIQYPKTELTADIKAFGLDKEGNEYGMATFKVEEFLSRQLYPLLPYVFFNENSEEIPPRYIRFNQSDVESFDENRRFLNSYSMDVYYNLLNIVGKRLTDNPKSNITLIGCNSDNRRENGSQDLSKNRAQKVMDYLVSVWGINSDRIQIKFRNLPEKASTGQTEDHFQENRRVEIHSEDWKIIQPVFVYDTLRIPTPPSVKFVMNSKSDKEISKWNIKVQQKELLNENSFIDVFGYSNPDSVLVWDLSNSQNKNKIPKSENPIDYYFSVTNTDDSTIIAKGSLPVEQITVQKKKRLRLADKEIDEYRLIMFDFDTPNILKQHQDIINLVCENVTPDSKIIITGMTDKLGTDEHNLQLSQKRADMVKSAMPCNNAEIQSIGKGKTKLHDNDVPEGRFYNRTVEVRVETPVKY